MGNREKQLQSEEVETPHHIVVAENTKGWSYKRLFGEQLKGARNITISDPFIRNFFQIRNLMEFLEMVHRLVPEGGAMCMAVLSLCLELSEHRGDDGEARRPGDV